MTRVPSIEGYLLDTNIALNALAYPERLSRSIRAALVQGPNVVSVVTYWEVALKAAKGKLEIGDPRLWWQATLDQLAATSLPLRAEHIAELHGLPSLHNDPFDRILIAQAAAESLGFVTTDAEIRRYASNGLRVIS